MILVSPAMLSSWRVLIADHDIECAVMELDREYQKMIDELPYVNLIASIHSCTTLIFCFSLLSDQADESKLSETTYMQRRTLLGSRFLCEILISLSSVDIALIGTHSRIARLHRPYLSRGYTPGSRFSYSRDRCLWSAGIMVQCHYKVKEITSRGSFW